jgi:hypothetical protein
LQSKKEVIEEVTLLLKKYEKKRRKKLKLKTKTYFKSR